MNLFTKKCVKLLTARSATVENVAVELAKECRAWVARQVFGKADVLSPKQLRGYIRAYATRALESAISGSDDFKSLSSRQIPAIIARAKEHLIESVAAEARSMPPKSEVGVAAAA